MKILLAALILALAACAPKAIPVPHQRGVEVPAAPPVAPHVESLRQANAAADQQGARVDEGAARVNERASQLAIGLRNAQAEADRLRKQQTATAKELEDLWKALVEETMKAIELHEEADRMRGLLKTERDLRIQANARIAPLEDAIRKLETESAGLRLQLADAEHAAESHAKLAQAQHDAAAKARAAAAHAKGKISVWRNIAAGAIALLLIAALLFYFKPRFL